MYGAHTAYGSRTVALATLSGASLQQFAATLTGLAPSTTYTATLSSGASGIKDVAGNALAADYGWSFTTAAGPSCPCSLFASLHSLRTP